MFFVPSVVLLVALLPACADRTSRHVDPSKNPFVKFEIMPEVVHPVRGEDLNRFRVEFRPLQKISEPLHLYRYAPDLKEKFVGTFHPGDASLTDRGDLKPSVNYTYVLTPVHSSLRVTRQKISLAITPDLHISGFYELPPQATGQKFSRIFFSPGSLLLTWGRYTNLEAEELIAPRDSAILVSDDYFKKTEGFEGDHRIGAFRLHAERASGSLTVYPSFPISSEKYTKQSLAYYRGKPPLGTQAFEISVGTSTDFTVVPSFDFHFPSETVLSRSDLSSAYLRPFSLALGETLSFLCGRELVSAAEFFGFYSGYHRELKKNVVIYVPSAHAYQGIFYFADSGEWYAEGDSTLSGLARAECLVGQGIAFGPVNRDLLNDHSVTGPEPVTRLKEIGSGFFPKMRAFAGFKPLMDFADDLQKLNQLVGRRGFTFDLGFDYEPQPAILSSESSRFINQSLKDPEPLMTLLKSRGLRGIRFNFASHAAVVVDQVLWHPANVAVSYESLRTMQLIPSSE